MMCDGDMLIGFGMVVVMYLVNCSEVLVCVWILLDGMVEVVLGM